MAGSQPVVISGAVEGDVDEAVLRRLVKEVRATIGRVYGKKGKHFLRKRIEGYNLAASFQPWVVLVDLDRDQECAPPFRSLWLPQPTSKMCFRVAVRAAESWLLADRERLATFLAIPPSRIPRDPEAELDPKRTMVDLAAGSRRREIRANMTPRPGSGRSVGPAYTSRLIEFILYQETGWRPDVAARSSESLRRCLECLRRLATS